MCSLDSIVLRLVLTCSLGNTILAQTHSNILRVFGLIQRHFSFFPDDAQSRFGHLGSATHPPILVAKGASKPLSGELSLAEYFVSPKTN